MKRFLAAFLPVFLWIASAIGQQSSDAATAVADAPAQQELTVESIFSEGGITGRSPEGMKWSPDSTRLTFVQRDDSGDHGALWYVDAASGEKKVLVSEGRLSSLAPDANRIRDEREKERVTRYHVAAYQWSPDASHVLFDSMGQLWLYTVANGTAIQFTSAPEPSLDPKFSPDGTRVAYISKHNLVVRPLALKGERQYTQDKDENILNGEVDWLYAEELEVRSNYFWSPSGREIAYLRMDETRVPQYPITDWMATHPKVDEEKYPKAGDPNPAVRIGVVNLQTGKTEWVALPLAKDADIYIPRFGWLKEGLIWAEVLNRAQDTMDLYFADPHSGHARKVMTESSESSWVNVNNDFHALKSGGHFLWSSWRDGHTHLYLYSFDQEDPLAADAKVERQLDRGDFEMLGLESVDEAAGRVYFSANKDDPRQVQLYSIGLDGSGLQQVSKGAGTHAVEFSDNGKYYVDRFSSTAVPQQISVCSVEGACKPVWQSKDLRSYKLAEPKQLEFQADDGTKLYGSLLLPEAGGDAKTPLIVNVYGGPAAQLVHDTWGGTTGLFHQLMAKRGYAIFSVDNRGTPARGRAFSAATRQQFGAVELKDQLAALDQLLKQYPQLDRSRVAMWGWSNGASMTLYALTHSDVFKAGVAVAPVTDWHNYDSTYTERYMGSPKENGKGYDEGSVTRSADQLHGALLLVHGTSDDNVHVQNTVQMVDALIKAGKPFRLMVYPNKTHGIAGKAARVHLFHMIEDHFDHELK